MRDVYHVPSRPLHAFDFDALPLKAADPVSYRRTVPGWHLCKKTKWTRNDSRVVGPYFTVIKRFTPMIRTEAWWVPKLDWIMEFRADCEVFEKNGSYWYAERDGHSYNIPREWGRTASSVEDWFAPKGTWPGEQSA